MVRIVRGNLVRQNTDAIINPVNADIVFDKGIPFFIKKSGGDRIEKECMKYYPAKLGDVFLTGAGDLPAKHIIHLVNRQFGQKTSYMILKNALNTALEAAVNLKIKSISIPTIYNRFSQEITANIICDSIVEMTQKHEEMKEMLMEVVIFDKEAAETFAKIFKSKLGNMFEE